MVKRVQNPFAAQTPIGAAIANFGQAIFGSRLSPTEMEKQRLETDLFRARTGLANQQTADLRQAASIRDSLVALGGQAQALRSGAVAPTPDIGVAGPARALSGDIAAQGRADARARLADIPRQAIDLSAGLIDNPNEAADFARGFISLDPNSTDSDVIRSLAATGSTLGKDASVSLAGQDRVRAANAANERLLARTKIAATPLTRSQVEGQDLQTLDPETRKQRLSPTQTQVRGDLLRRTIEAADAGEQVPDVVARGGLGAQAPGLDPLVQVVDDSGVVREVPRSVVNTPDNSAEFSRFGQAAPKASQTLEDLSGLSKSNRAKVESSAIAMGDFKIVMDDLEAIATSEGAETFFGVAGNLRRAAQGARGQIGALEQTLGGEDFNDITAELAEAAQREGRVFDANLANIDRVATLAAFQAAKALAQQEGKALSDNDFRIFRSALGDPTSFLSNQQTFLAGIRKMRSLAERMLALRHRALVGGIDAIAGDPPTPAPSAGGGDDVTSLSDEELLRQLEAQ